MKIIIENNIQIAEANYINKSLFRGIDWKIFICETLFIIQNLPYYRKHFLTNSEKLKLKFSTYSYRFSCTGKDWLRLEEGSQICKCESPFTYKRKIGAICHLTQRAGEFRKKNNLNTKS